MELQAFLQKYPAGKTTPAAKETIDKYKGLVPSALIELWEKQGFGKYGNGLIEIFNPDDFQDTLARWLGRKVDNYVPIAISAFGDLFYYRKLTETDEDVCYIDPQYRRINVCTWSLTDFFNDYLLSEENITDFLRKNLFEQAFEQNGELTNNEIYIFKLAFMIGGAEEIGNVDKGNAQVQLEILFQMGL